MEQDQGLLVKLREAKEARGLSHQDIVDITEENGEAVSLSSVRRVFDKDAKIEDFRYKTTLRPIIRAVLGFDEENKPPESRPTLQQAEQDYTTIEALKALVEFKSDMLNKAVGEYTATIKMYRRVVAVFGLVCVLVLVALIADLSIGHLGWVRY